MQVVIVAGFAVWGGIDGYKYAKKKGFTGWKKAGAIAGGAIIGAVPVGKVFKGAKVIAKSTKVVKKAKIIKKVKKPKKITKKKKGKPKSKSNSTGRTSANNLKEKLAMEEVKSNPLKNAKET